MFWLYFALKSIFAIDLSIFMCKLIIYFQKKGGGFFMGTEKCSTGIQGLDEILHGGLIPQGAYLVRGGPGSGKTTLGLHFLADGIKLGQSSLFISLEEPESAICSNAASCGFNLDKMNFLDLSPTSDFFAEVKSYDIFSPAEVEREPLTSRIISEIERLKPNRVFVDPMTQFRYFASDLFQYRRQVLSFIRFLKEKGATVLFSSENSAEAPDEDLQFLSDGIICLDNSVGFRRVCVTKFRGSNFLSGWHSMRITNHGVRIAPRLIPEEHMKSFSPEIIGSGIPELDEQLNGGLERGTTTIISGPTGVGKTTLGLQFMKEAAGRGERSVVFTFEEEPEIMLRRAESVHISAKAMIDKGTLEIIKIEPLKITADEFALLVREQVEKYKTRIVMLDSVSGYSLTVQGENMAAQLHALCKYLQNMGVATLLATETNSIVGDFVVTDVGFSYLGDNIIFLRYIEIEGQLRKAIGVLKKRLSDFEKNLREFEISKYGIKVGKPLSNLRGILTGTPTFDESHKV